VDQEEQAGRSIEELIPYGDAGKPVSIFFKAGESATVKPYLFSAIVAFFIALPAGAQGGFVDNTGRSATSGVLTVEEAKKLRDDSPVQLQGAIVRALGDEKYVLRDASGEIIVEIDDDVWRGVTVGPDDKVEIRGEVDRDFPGFPVEIEVDVIRKL
jgi:uncharacterized protein (TIGR00156 family)